MLPGRLVLARQDPNARCPPCFQRCVCCQKEIPLCKIAGVPIKVHALLALFVLYRVAAPFKAYAHRREGAGGTTVAVPWWFIFASAVGEVVLLFGTIIVHEFGHGLTARRIGGEIAYILLWPLGGICFHTMPQGVSVKEKLWNDWWVTCMGPSTHLWMAPLWAIIVALLYGAFGLLSSIGAVLSVAANPFGQEGVSEDVIALGWSCALLFQLAQSAIRINIILFLFNVLIPMYPMDSAKMLVTGMQLCGVGYRTAAGRLVAASALFTAALFGLAAYEFYLHMHPYFANPSPKDLDRIVQPLAFGFAPIPFSVLLTLALATWGLNETKKIYKLWSDRDLHKHPMFCHVRHKTMRVRDIDNGRPDVFVEITRDDDDSVPREPATQRTPLVVRDGVLMPLVRDAVREPQEVQVPVGMSALPRQEIVRGGFGPGYPGYGPRRL